MTTAEEAANALKESLDIDTEARLVGLLPTYIKARDAETRAKAQKESIGDSFKKWLKANPDKVLYDGELELQAVMKDKAAPGRTCDFNSLYQNDLALLVRLIQNGCLRIDEDAVKKAGPLVSDVERYLAPKRRTESLYVGAV
jgi:succinate dehydrogenase/fumarate reductase flavoprotein subunit